MDVDFYETVSSPFLFFSVQLFPDNLSNNGNKTGPILGFLKEQLRGKKLVSDL